MKLILELVEDLLNPGRDWGEFSRRMISIIVLSLVTFVGVDVYWNLKERSDPWVPVIELMETKPDKAEQVKRLMEKMLYLHSEIRSVWLYSWPDAANLDVVHQVGDPSNPIPTGHFWASDAHDVGKLGLDICTELRRNQHNTACAIIGNGDSWGLLVVVWDQGKPRPEGYKEFVASTASRISHLLYSEL